MEKIFYTRGKGRVRKSLDVFSDGHQFRLLFTVLDRTNPSKADRAAGMKEKRFIAFEEEFFISHNDQIIPSKYPFPELVEAFVVYLNGNREATRETDSN
ncbi:hypothetical protein DOF57_24575 [Salmonella enterica]|uniref:Uncharacterized protein n=2 Tax=Salmonella enterica TaxID=28901 RepID=A0A615W5K5_SALER|nr:hypothetical protein [Salmonella enterica]EAA5645013.1 hypothetical protein [Salmonella enterica subsp. enterica serovar Javiana]EAT8443915.1 hypothetical protein [Salmonella enterica subsp. enterica serovar Bonariensis]EAV6083512.1 hypothetical protein [Salmonella enterica subsp. enterica serovar Braenderup]EBG5302298.1 hypothetical protein [Salmonella enterica subsp. enterica serovar Oranienburg]EBW1447857.1 hypothetical protein [Salmonella enterica subsp. enterica serovar Agona]ECB90730